MVFMLVKKTKPDGSKTIYVGGIYEADKTSRGAVTRTVTYYPAAGAMRINISGGSNTVYYILKDHLGSASVMTDASGNIVGENRYYPYGETRFTSGTLYTDKLFTGQHCHSQPPRFATFSPNSPGTLSYRPLAPPHE